MNAPLTPEMSEAQGREALNGALTKLMADVASLQGESRTLAEKLTIAERAAADYRQELAVEREGRMALAASAVVDPDARGLARFNVRDSSGNERIMFGGGTVDGEWRDGLLDSRRVFGEWHSDLRAAVTDYNLVRVFGLTPTIAARRLRRVLDEAPAHIKQRIFGASGSADWIPTQNIMPELDTAVGLRFSGTLAGYFKTRMVTNGVYTAPYLGGAPTAYLQGAPVPSPADYQESDISTAARTKTVKTMVARVLLDRYSAEDSIIDARAEIIGIIADTLSSAYEDSMVNGNTATTGDVDTLASWNPRSRWAAAHLGSAIDHRKGWIGLRHLAFDAGNTLDMASLQTIAGIMQLRGKVQAGTISDGVLNIMNEKWFWTKLASLAEVLTQDKRGAQASIDTGKVDAIARMPMVTSYFMTDDLNASGVYDNTTMTKAGLLCVDSSRFQHYEARGQLVEVGTNIDNGTISVVGSLRRIFGSPDLATVKNVAYGFNLL